MLFDDDEEVVAAATLVADEVGCGRDRRFPLDEAVGGVVLGAGLVELSLLLLEVLAVTLLFCDGFWMSCCEQKVDDVSY